MATDTDEKIYSKKEVKEFLKNVSTYIMQHGKELAPPHEGERNKDDTFFMVNCLLGTYQFVDVANYCLDGLDPVIESQRRYAIHNMKTTVPRL